MDELKTWADQPHKIREKKHKQTLARVLQPKIQRQVRIYRKSLNEVKENSFGGQKTATKQRTFISM